MPHGGQHRRTRTFVAAGTVVMLVIVAAAALAVAHAVGGSAKHNAETDASQGVDLLVIVGPRLPDLTRARVSAGLTASEAGQLDRAVERGRRAGVLSSLEVWNSSGRIMYARDDRVVGTRPPMEPDVREALSGRRVSGAEPTEFDATSRRRTGVLSALEPLGDRGHVYGAVEVSLPLRPVDASAAGIERTIVLLILGGAALMWLLLLPLTRQIARAVAAQWVPGRRRTLRALRHGLARGEIELVYQPQVSPVTGVVVSVEALVRWRRGGTLEPPDRFLPVAESSTLMPALTDRVIDLAVAQQAAWGADGIVLRMSVNLSATDLADPGLPERIAAALARHGVSARQLTVEVTETAILEDDAQARRVLEALTATGIEVAVDDFGTGHASIARLHEFPVREVKIDRLFVSDTTPRARTYLAAMVAFGQYLGLRVVAEGIEDVATLAFLSEVRCDLAQGYHIARPMDADALVAWLPVAVRAAA
jgi:EAL domain-containing protein (putative c-di-GMP-specific phosphodiesterase class I)